MLGHFLQFPLRGYEPMLQISCRRIYRRGYKKKLSDLSAKMSANIGNILATLKKYKNIHFFQFSKHLKQQEHQLNTLIYEYGKKSHI